MVMTDPIADLLTRVRNANSVRHEVVEVPSSSVKKAIVNILLQEGYLKGVEEYNDGVVPMMRLTLKYGANNERVITGLKRISKPGLRVYCKKDEVPRVLNGLGIALISTSKGLLVDREARKLGLGGEVICYVW
ncbi:30S ribosomal protein S8 [Clostridium perfringens]|uniref:30S ribosomal protein S8 n=1 Tax=Clostridium perfringens TaxID=1502 RepID=UPI0013E3ECDA|nr:30S ribosomal protein S8 [Clostridium perfringens]MDK0927927.1 30S ribosomal protein S8 [Clostridium perfringens]NGU12214.1 30S ribosomal protein S8 [Clostridium perfringens]